jgi:hypothetical protein
MQVMVLDKKKESNALCYLCKIDLISYINSVPDTYRDFDVQRGIVSNRYLDHLADTIARKRHIPPIVLVTDELTYDGHVANIEDYRILDGLQRTHRLRIIWNVLDYLLSGNEKATIIENTARFVRKNSQDIRALGGDTKLVKRLVSLEAFPKLKTAAEFFAGNEIWLEIWTGLNKSEQIEKMLLLNAGHKSVNIKHQLELLFLSTLFRLEDIAPEGVLFSREKDQSSIQYSKTRHVGQYHFSHLISALVALSAGKIVNTNSDFVSDMQSNQHEFVELVEGFDLELISTFVAFIHEMDKQLVEAYGDAGTRWLGREVVLVGIFGAIGEYSEDVGLSRTIVLTTLQKNLFSLVQRLDLLEFEAERNAVELNKVNVGNVNKRAVYRAIHDLIRNETFAGWQVYFGVPA